METIRVGIVTGFLYKSVCLDTSPTSLFVRIVSFPLTRSGSIVRKTGERFLVVFLSVVLLLSL